MVHGPLPEKQEIRDVQGFRAAHAAQEAATQAYLLEGSTAELEAFRAAYLAFAAKLTPKVANAHDPLNDGWPHFVAGMALTIMRGVESEAWALVCEGLPKKPE